MFFDLKRIQMFAKKNKRKAVDFIFLFCFVYFLCQIYFVSKVSFFLFLLNLFDVIDLLCFGNSQKYLLLLTFLRVFNF